MKIKPGFRITVACLIVILGDSCHNNRKANSKHKKTFFDSVAAQLDLSFKQVRRHTGIDSGYFTAKSKFTGIPFIMHCLNFRLQSFGMTTD